MVHFVGAGFVGGTFCDGTFYWGSFVGVCFVPGDVLLGESFTSTVVPCVLAEVSL